MVGTAYSLTIPLASVSPSSVRLYSEPINVHMPSCVCRGVCVCVCVYVCVSGSPSVKEEVPGQGIGRDTLSITKQLILQTSITPFSGQAL